MYPGFVEEVRGPLSVCSPGTLHGTFAPEKWKGDRLWLVAFYGEVAYADDKVGGLKREILCELPWEYKE